MRRFFSPVFLLLAVACLASHPPAADAQLRTAQKPAAAAAAAPSATLLNNGAGAGAKQPAAAKPKPQTRPETLHLINDDNWQQVLEGEWMLQFHAPWCPACRAMVESWNDLARLTYQLGIEVGKADVTLSPALSGRFFITALPTILHVQNGEFTQYRGPRDAETLKKMIATRQWHHMEPLAWWKHPASPQMTVVAWFFKLSHALKELNTYLVQTFKMPIWLTYAFFAVVTIALGAIIGLFFVCIVDLVVPPRRKSYEELQSDDPMAEYLADELEVEEPLQRLEDGDGGSSGEEDEKDSEEEEEEATESEVEEEEQLDEEGKKKKKNKTAQEEQEEDELARERQMVKQAKAALRSKAAKSAAKVLADLERTEAEEEAEAALAEQNGARKRKPRKAD